MELRTVPRAARRAGRELARRARTEVDWFASRRGGADLALFHEFEPSPSGGGHQFLRALARELGSRGLDVERTACPRETPACLFNSFNFDFARLRRFAGTDVPMVHRVDGPIGVYRGFDDGTDDRIAAVNGALADATVLQSRYSLEKHLELGLELRDPVVIPNAVDPAIFHPPERREPLDGRKVRLVAASWSDNRRKGAETLAWLDRNLDRARYELTFVGQLRVRFERIRSVGPVASRRGRRALSSHDVYVAPSRDDPCSNALLEALACGLPAAFLESGGHPELVGEGGLPFEADEELPDVLDRLVEEIEMRRAAICDPVDLRRRRPLPRHVARARRKTRPRVCAVDEPPATRPERPLASASAARLDRAAVSRAHDVFYASNAWTQATWLGEPGAEEPARPLGLPGDHGRDPAGASSSRPGPIAAAARTSWRPCATSSARARSSRSTSSRCATTTRSIRGSRTSAGRSSTDPDVLDGGARARARGDERSIVLDSDHSQAHVEAELEAYAPLVPVGCYLIVEDSNIGQIRPDLMPGPLQAIETFLAWRTTS